MAATNYDLSRIAARQQRDDDALELLQEALDRGWAERALVSEPDFRHLRGDPRFTAIVREVAGRRGPA